MQKKNRSSAESQKQKQLCCICSKRLVTAETDQCRHRFCMTCINAWVKSQQKDEQKEISSCPLCRTEIKAVHSIRTGRLLRKTRKGEEDEGRRPREIRRRGRRRERDYERDEEDDEDDYLDEGQEMSSEYSNSEYDSDEYSRYSQQSSMSVGSRVRLLDTMQRMSRDYQRRELQRQFQRQRERQLQRQYLLLREDERRDNQRRRGRQRQRQRQRDGKKSGGGGCLELICCCCLISCCLKMIGL